MRVLCILDPLERLNFVWDTSLFLLKELFRRRHAVFVAYAGDIESENGQVLVRAREVSSILEKEKIFRIAEPVPFALTQFDLVLIRKEPPFDETYLYLTHLLETAARQGTSLRSATCPWSVTTGRYCSRNPGQARGIFRCKVPMVNHPTGIRNANEKLAILNFPDLIPETLVTSSGSEILKFQARLQQDIVIKPLNLMGGKDIVRIQYGAKSAASSINQATRYGKKFIMAQRFLQWGRKDKDKRILLLNGEVLAAFEKQPPRGEFRSNLSLGGTAHRTQLTSKEKKIVRRLKPYLLREGIYFAGVDVLCEKLIEINVTCPSGLYDATMLYPRRGLVKTWANSLESFASYR